MHNKIVNSRIKPLDTEPEIYIIEATPEPSPVVPDSQFTSPIAGVPADDVTQNQTVDTTENNMSEKTDADNAKTINAVVTVAISEEVNKPDDNANTLTDIFNVAISEEGGDKGSDTSQENVEEGANNAVTNDKFHVEVDEEDVEDDTIFTGVEEKSGPSGTVVDTLIRSGTDLSETVFDDIFDAAIGFSEEEENILRMQQEAKRQKIAKRVTIDIIPVIIENKVSSADNGHNQWNENNDDVQNTVIPVNGQVCTAEQLNNESKMIINMLLKRSSQKLEEHFTGSDTAEGIRKDTQEAERILLKDDNEYVTALNYKEAAETIVKSMIKRSVARLQKEVLTHSDEADIKRRPVDT